MKIPSYEDVVQLIDEAETAKKNYEADKTRLDLFAVYNGRMVKVLNAHLAQALARLTTLETRVAELEKK